MNYQIGDHVGFVDLMQGIPTEAPIAPQRWHMLQVFPGREVKVMRALSRRFISAYLPIEVRSRNRRTGQQARRKHLGHVIRSPFLPGLLFVPDFELERLGSIEIDGVEGVLYVGPCLAGLSLVEFDQLRAILKVINTPRSQRKFELGQMVRITDGPFIGFEGKVDRLDSRGRLKVFLDAVKRGVSVQMAETQIEAADHCHA